MLLDTNIVVDLARGRNLHLLDPIRSAERRWVSFIVLAELEEGCFRAPDPERERHRITRLLAALGAEIFLPNGGTPFVWARIMDELRVAGTPMSDHDVWIAAQARQYNLTVVSRDKAFGHVSGLERLDMEPPR